MTAEYRAADAVSPLEIDLGFARLDIDRARRTGDPEVVFGAGKEPGQVVRILETLHAAHPDRAVLATRLSAQAVERCLAALPGVRVDAVGRTATLGTAGPPRGRVAVVTGGTADLPVARECAATLEAFGTAAHLVPDVGVAGLRRLVERQAEIEACDVVIAVAGMEAALVSVLGGLTGRPLIGLPTSVGYGWHMEGLTAWLATLNSCAPGVVSVNVDNGFGAAVAAARIARSVVREQQ